MTATNWPTNGFACGADWNPDQWPREVWRRDLELMVAAGVNLVTLPVFGWAALEQSEGEFTFEWLDEILDATHAAGISVDLATGTATPPAWLVRQHPDVLPVNRDGVRLEYGSRQSYCLNSAHFIAGSQRLARTMAERYAAHPAVTMWHISNEYGDHVTRCYCQNCDRAFRVWLRAKYTDIAALNEAWGTAMWGQLYTDFEHITTPRTTMAPANPTHTLDFARFSTDSINALFDAEREILRELSPNLPVTTNFMTVMTDVDYWKLAPRLDIISFDNYPDPANPDSHHTAGLNYSLMRSLAQRKPWMLLESATSAVSWRGVNVAKPRGKNRADSFLAVAHGADSVMYFQWRASRVGAERFHSAVVGHFGEASRTLRETTEIWHELHDLREIAGSTVRASVALMLDWESRWALQGPETMPSDQYSWLSQILEYYQALTRLGLSVNIVHPDSALKDYDIVVAPAQFMLSDEQGARLEQFVKDGGQLILGPFSAVVDAHNHVHYGGAPGPLAEVLGVRVEEVWPLATDDHVEVVGPALNASADAWTEFVHYDGNHDILAKYMSGPLAGQRAATAHDFGAGKAMYVSCILKLVDLTTLLAQFLRIENSPELQHGVEIHTRTNGEHDYTFVINFGQTPIKVRPTIDVEVLLGHLNRYQNQYDVLVLKSATTQPTLKQMQLVEVVQ